MELTFPEQTPLHLFHQAVLNLILPCVAATTTNTTRQSPVTDQTARILQPIHMHWPHQTVAFGVSERRTWSLPYALPAFSLSQRRVLCLQARS